MFKKNKYGAVKSFAHGRYWPSKLELAVYEMLLLFQRGGRVSDLKCQVHVRFHTHDHGYTKMIPDFSAIDCKTGVLSYFEAKGVFTREFARKKKAWSKGGPGPLYIYGGNWKYPKLIETVIPKTLEAA